MSRYPQRSDQEQKPLSSEGRAALEERLATLRALEAERRANPRQIVQFASTNLPSNEFVSPSYPNEHDAFEDGDLDAEHEAFMNFIEETLIDKGSCADESTQNLHQSEHTSTAYVVGNALNSTKQASFRTPGFRDFEVLWFVKFGDITSFQDHCAVQGIDIKNFYDNQKRNALHYVADNGSVSMLELLATLEVPYTPSERGITPMDVAILTNQSADFKAGLCNLAKKNKKLQETDPVDQEEQKTFEEVRSRFEPEPPRFVISRRPPTPTVFAENVSERFFWKCQFAKKNGKNIVVLNFDTILSGPDAELDFCIRVNSPDHGNLAAAVDTVNRLYTGWGLSSWLKPLDLLVGHRKGFDIKCFDWNRYLFLTASPRGEGIRESAASDLPLGVLASLVLGGRLEGVDVESDISTRTEMSSFALAGYLAVDPRYHGSKLSSLLMRSLAKYLLEKHSCAALAFTTQVPIPHLPPPTSMIKWYRRVLNVNKVFSSPYAENIFPEFFEEDEILRADCVLKGTLAPMLRITYADALQDWVSLEAANKDQAQCVFDFLNSPERQKLDLEFKWNCLESFHQVFFPPKQENVLKVLMRKRRGSDSADDFVIFRLRQVRHQVSEFPASSTKPDINLPLSEQNSLMIAQVVYALFTGLKGSDKMAHVLLIAQEMLQADVLLVPNLFGFTDSDLAKTNFDEKPMWREMLYVLVDNRQRKGPPSDATASFLSPVPPSRLCLPIFLF